MPTLKNQSVRALFALCLFAIGGRALHAAPAVDIISIDLAPLIDRAAESPNRFAVDVPHPVSTKTNGEWSQSSGISTWTYSVQIPAALSMSFHATDALLPPSATLILSADGVDYPYSSKDVRGGDLWSRIGRGDSLTIRLTVATDEVERVRLEIASFQAGYRILGDDGRTSPNYDDLRKHALATAAPCAENWTCHVDATNSGPGDATVALAVNNTYLCTGVLLNGVPADGAPYILTARHCQSGSSDGGNPGAAGSIVVYWNAATPCGSPLGNVFSSATQTQFGADTVVEQQDSWLVRLRSLPVLADPYYAGWDATGGTFVGGFSPHHADATARQFVGWYGQAVYFTLPPDTFGLKYTSTVWGTVNSVGTGGPGSSGAGLFNDTGHLVGTIARGQVAADGTGLCPVNPPPVPTPANAVAISTALSGIFDSTADPGSSTGAATLKTVLDPGNTGTLVVEGVRRPIAVTLTASTNNPASGTTVQLSWSTASSVTSCTASGGEAGDGWPGPVANSGSKTVIAFDSTDVKYTITCTDGQKTGSANVTVHWILGTPTVSLFTYNFPAYGESFTLYWGSNVTPCSATGGTVGDGWGGSVDLHGTMSLTENIVGRVTFTVTCGSGSRVAKQDLTLDVAPPQASIIADVATLRIGELVNIGTNQRGAPCVKTGGGAGDGWAGALTELYGSTFQVVETVAGTYTYTVACGSGSHIATAQTSVTFRNEPPAVSIQASASTGVINVDTIQVSWDSNVRPCYLTITPPAGDTFPWQVLPHQSYSFQQAIIGRYVFDIACGAGTTAARASTVINLTGSPTVEVQGPTGAVRGIPFSLTYFANTVPCTTSGGTQGDGWAGQFNAWVQSVNVTEPAAGKYTYTVTCGPGTQTATASTTVEIVADAPQVTLTATPAAQVAGQPITLSWSSNVSPCVPSGGRTGDGWAGPLGTSGSMTVTESTAGEVFFAIQCGTGWLTARTYTIVPFAQWPAPRLTASKTEANTGDTITLTWSSADGSDCFATGGVAADNWYGLRPASGSVNVRLFVPGSVSFSLACAGSLTATVQVAVHSAPPQVTLTASVPSLTVGDPLTLRYTVSSAEWCTASGGSAGDGWTGSLATQGGSLDVRPTLAGTLTYTITCAGGGTTSSASANVTVASAASAPTSSGGGGGGSMGPLDLAFFLSLGLLGWWQRRAPSSSSAT